MWKKPDFVDNKSESDGPEIVTKIVDGADF